MNRAIFGSISLPIQTLVNNANHLHGTTEVNKNWATHGIYQAWGTCGVTRMHEFWPCARLQVWRDWEGISPKVLTKRSTNFMVFICLCFPIPIFPVNSDISRSRIESWCIVIITKGFRTLYCPAPYGLYAPKLRCEDIFYIQPSIWAYICCICHPFM